MKRTGRALIVVVVLGLHAALAWQSAPLAAQEKYPNRPVDFIVTWGTGGGADAMARQIGSLAQPVLGVALPVSNVPGASGNTGLAQILNGKTDGYAVATYIQDTLMTIPMGLARHKVDDLEWIVRTQVADSFCFRRGVGRNFREGPLCREQGLCAAHALQRARGQLRSRQASGPRTRRSSRSSRAAAGSA